MPRNQGWSIEEPLASFCSDIRQMADPPPGRWASPEGLERLEWKLHHRAGQLCDVIMAVIVQTILVTTQFCRHARANFRAETPGNWRSKGKRSFDVRFLGGSTFTFEIGYLVDQQGDGWEGRQGCFPAMMALGIDQKAKVSAALGEEVLRQVAVSDSFAEARRRLARRGVEMTESRLHKIWTDLTSRLVEDRQVYLQEPSPEGPVDPDVWAGADIVISLDGGRARIREYLGGRPRKSGYHGFEADWKEPKLLTIYAIDDQGDRLESIDPIIDGTMGDADRVFELLEGYLEAIDISQAASVTVTADGAKWIWKRAGPLLERQGVAEEIRREIVDLWHARQHLWEIVEMPDIDGWDKGCQRVWFERFNSALEDGDIDQLVRRVRKLQSRCDRNDLVEHVDYFQERSKRMQYQDALDEDRPIGSGAIESAIRRVVGLRMKGCGTFWTKPGAERMLLVRSWLKAGRLADMWRYSTRRHARGWSENDAAELSWRQDIDRAA